MVQLLVSVVSATEARMAICGGADLIDVKDPRKGSLGAADHDAVQSVVSEIAGAAAVSIALGELRDLGSLQNTEAFPHIAFAKLGLSGCASLPDWPDRWTRALRQLAPSARPVAVAYADWRHAAAPEPARVVAEATRMGCAAVLVDTYDKSRGNLVDWWELESLAEFVASVQRLGMLAVLAGSLTIETIPRVAAIEPDYIAVRGAACDGGRDGMLSLARVRRIAEILAQVKGQRFTSFA
jgi:(5-formylfuran-3-yl)methyl phosphate synthase